MGCHGGLIKSELWEDQAPDAHGHQAPVLSPEFDGARSEYRAWGWSQPRPGTRILKSLWQPQPPPGDLDAFSALMLGAAIPARARTPCACRILPRLPWWMPQLGQINSRGSSRCKRNFYHTPTRQNGTCMKLYEIVVRPCSTYRPRGFALPCGWPVVVDTKDFGKWAEITMQSKASSIPSLELEV